MKQIRNIRTGEVIVEYENCLTIDDLKDKDLTFCDFSNSSFCCYYFPYVDFNGSDFSGADFSGASFEWDQLKHIIPYIKNKIPKITNIRQTVYRECLGDKFNMNAWHCGTTHCEAGFVVTIAGKEGADLEYELGTSLAALVIYHENSNIKSSYNDFIENNEDALTRMKESARIEREAK